VIMPNHVHLLIQTEKEESLNSILQSLKGFSGLAINKLLNRKGKFWEEESYDRVVRDEKHFDICMKYIIKNPVKAGLCQDGLKYKWSYFYFTKLQEDCENKFDK